jgi:hypothetical protein
METPGATGGRLLVGHCDAWVGLRFVSGVVPLSNRGTYWADGRPSLSYEVTTMYCVEVKVRAPPAKARPSTTATW